MLGRLAVSKTLEIMGRILTHKYDLVRLPLTLTLTVPLHFSSIFVWHIFGSEFF